MENKSTHYLYLILFGINVQLRTIYILFINFFGSIFPLVTEEFDGRSGRETWPFYDIDCK